MRLKWLWGLVLILGCVLYTSAQEPKYIQTEPDDMVTRYQIDQDIYRQMMLLNRQTQADTVVLTAGQTKDTVYLDQKYKDTNYMVFASIRTTRGTVDANYVIIPLDDSSFTIAKHTSDSSWVQWMTIHK